MSPAPPAGPACARCGCTALEHERLINEAWCLVGGRCLSCSDCLGFELEPGEQRETTEVDHG